MTTPPPVAAVEEALKWFESPCVYGEGSSKCSTCAAVILAEEVKRLRAVNAELEKGLELQRQYFLSAVNTRLDALIAALSSSKPRS